MQSGVGSDPSVATKAGGAVAGHGGDNAGNGIDSANAIVEPVSDEQVTIPIQRNAERAEQLGGGGGHTITAVAGEAGAGYGGDNAGGGIHPTNARVVKVGDEQVAGPVQRDAERAVQQGVGSGPAIAAGADNAVAGHGGDNAGNGIHPPDAIVARVGDEQVAGAIHHHAVRELQTGAGCEPAIAAVAGVAVAS